MSESEAPPVLSARTGMSTILSVNATALSGPWCTTSVNNLVQELQCGISLLWHNWNVRHSVEELNRGPEHVRLGLLEHNQHDHTDVHNHPGPVFVYRSGLAVLLVVGCWLLVVGCCGCWLLWLLVVVVVGWVLLLGVVVGCSEDSLKCAYVHDTEVMQAQRSLLAKGGPTHESELPASAPTPGSPRRRRTLHHRGPEKSAQPGTQPLAGESEKWAKPASKSSLSSVDD